MTCYQCAGSPQLTPEAIQERFEVLFCPACPPPRPTPGDGPRPPELRWCAVCHALSPAIAFYVFDPDGAGQVGIDCCPRCQARPDLKAELRQRFITAQATGTLADTGFCDVVVFE